MSSFQLVDRALLARASDAAAESPRRRKNYNFHRKDDACHRLLNAMEPDSYIPPHCHLDPAKDETILALRGKFGLVLFEADGTILTTAVLQAGGEAMGVDIPHGVFHTLVALEPQSVFFESKGGPYRPLAAEEKADWAPAEGAPDAAEYLDSLKELFPKS